MTNLDSSSPQSSIAAKPTKNSRRPIYYVFVFFALIGLVDALFLTSRYFSGTITCSLIHGCQEVLTSPYSHLGPIPIAAFGAAYYLVIIILTLIYLRHKNNLAHWGLKIFPSLAFIFSLWLVYLQAFVIKALCQYCLLSALTSTILFIVSLILIKKK